jgi:hypothetical protein
MASLSPSLQGLLENYERGPAILEAALADFPAARLREPLPPGQWSAHQVVCHICDFEIVGADRMKAVVAEDGPQIPGRDETRYAARLHYDARNLADELALIAAVRRQVSALVRSLSPAEFQRVGIHSIDGPLTLETLLTRLTGHLPHHAGFIERKKRSLLKPA